MARVKATDSEGQWMDYAAFVNEHAKTADLGLKYLLNHQVTDPEMPPNHPKDPEGQAQMLAAKSAKIRFLARILLFYCHHRGAKIIVVVEWPLIAMYAAVFSLVLGFGVMTLTAEMGQKEKAEIQDRWNDAKDPCKVLVSTGRVISSGYNLHHACHVMALLDCPSSYFLMFQRIGRVHQIGQKNYQFIYHLFGVGTIEEYRHYGCTAKLGASICRVGEGAVKNFFSEDLDDLKQSEFDLQSCRISIGAICPIRSISKCGSTM